MNAKIKITPENIQELEPNEIFVFGSNLSGIHGGGAARLAKDKFGAIMGVGEGITGNCYALPTKDKNIETLPIGEIHKSVEVLYQYARDNNNKHFLVTAIGCGLAGYTAKDIAPMFEPFVHLNNCSLPQSFIDIIFPPKIRGYKVMDSKMQCRGYQFTMNKVHKTDGYIKSCVNGFHFCKKLVDCFEYYPFDPENRVFEVEGMGDYDFEHDKVCTREVKVLRELSWFEVLSLVNTGRGNSGKDNSGNYNSGNRNSGNYNSGDYNSGDCNSGDCNSGNYNSGNRNSGNRNSGDCNSGNYNSGYFNNDEPFARIFGKETDIKVSQVNIPYIELKTTEWVSESYMTDEEKKENPKFFVSGGYLKKRSYKNAWKLYWENDATESDKARFLSLPNFDADIFEDITGIRVNL
jgi:hypothetical protein